MSTSKGEEEGERRRSKIGESEGRGAEGRRKGKRRMKNYWFAEAINLVLHFSACKRCDLRNISII